MEKENVVIIEEILRKCNWYEKIVVKLFKKLILKVFHYSRVNTINIILK